MWVVNHTALAPVKAERWLFARRAIGIVIISRHCYGVGSTSLGASQTEIFCLQNTDALLKATAVGINST